VHIDKQEIFMNDVTNCVTSLKKVVQEFQSGAADLSLQMAQSHLRFAAPDFDVADPNTSADLLQSIWLLTLEG
jgi:hypothetical protein